MEGFVYAVMVPLGVSLLLLAGALMYERYTTQAIKIGEIRKTLRVLIRIAGVLTVGAMLSVIPALLSYTAKPILGWVSFFIVIPILYRLDILMEGTHA